MQTSSSLSLPGDRIACRIRDLARDSLTDLRLVVPETAEPAVPYGEVVFVGPKVTLAVPGDKILFLPNHATVIPWEKEQLWFITEGNIMAKITTPNESTSPKS